jgi:LacI family transcriptional regulator
VTQATPAGQRVRAQDIAKRAGLSLTTVRQILSGRGDRYRAATRDRILALASDMGYRSHAGALAISTGRFRCLAMVTSVVSSRSVWSGPLWEGLQLRLMQDDYHLAVTCLPDAPLSQEDTPPKLLREQMADALLMNYTYDLPAGLLTALEQHAVPAVWINRRLDHDAVYPDDRGAGRAATEAMLAAGHRRITYCSSHGDSHFSDPARAQGYADAMHAAGLPPEYCLGNAGRDAWMVQAKAVLSAPNRPTALVGYSPHSVYPFALIAASLGLAVPRDLSLATFSGYTANDIGPELSTWIVPQKAMGTAVADLALTLLSDGCPQPSRCVPFTDVSGASIAPPIHS